ncbi:MAG: beta-glucosidase [Acidimicrobiia bacterium]|nr:beta-glucosidase [Acidimicrobiia bacterium]
MTRRFPDYFLWGAATASYQIEGAVAEDGRSESVWDRFCRIPGRVLNGDTGDVACDHYHRWRDDIRIMEDLGLSAYRFSAAWPRVVPEGRGPVNQAGLDFYDRLVDGLLETGIEPFLTLFHWDLPQCLEDEGGWRVRGTAHAFAEYAAAVESRLGDRVKHWLTLNEPWVVAHLGHRTGQHAPGLVNSGTEFDVIHHQLLGHGLAAQALRAGHAGSEIGIALNLEPKVARSDHPLDLDAAALEEGLMNRWFLDPVTGRGYPDDLRAVSGWPASVVVHGDLDVIAEPLDAVGLNYYRTEVVGHPGLRDCDRPAPLRNPPPEITEMGWPVTPSGLGEMLRMLDGYGFEAIYITENGAAFPDTTRDGGMVQDEDRRSYLERHLIEAAMAIGDGVPLRGYFAWTLLDNFEWSLGYSRRFGLIHVDHATQQRTPKASGHWYRDVIARNGI